MPKIGIYGYVICVFLTELVNLAFSLNRLLTVTGVKNPALPGDSLSCRMYRRRDLSCDARRKACASRLS